MPGRSGHAGPPRGYRSLPGSPDSSIGRQCKGEWRIVLCKWCNSARNCTPLRIYRRRCKPLDLPSDPPGCTLSCRSNQNGTEAALAPQAAIPPPFRLSLPRFLDTHGGACYVLVLSRPRGISVTSPATSALRKTSLNAVHRRMRARMVSFGGWDMPVEDPATGGLRAEDLALRPRAGVVHVRRVGDSWLEADTPRDRGWLRAGI